MIEIVEISEATRDVLNAITDSSANLIAIALEQHKNLINEEETIISAFSHFNQTIITLRYAEKGQRTEWYVLSWQEFVGLGITFSSFSLN